MDNVGGTIVQYRRLTVIIKKVQLSGTRPFQKTHQRTQDTAMWVARFQLCDPCRRIRNVGGTIPEEVALVRVGTMGIVRSMQVRPEFRAKGGSESKEPPMVANER
jgi:hypothetical protein